MDSKEVLSEYQEKVFDVLDNAGIKGIDYKPIVEGWFANMDSSIKSAYPSEMYEAAYMYLKTHDIQSMVNMSGADLSKNSPQRKAFKDELSKHDLYKTFEDRIGKDNPNYAHIEEMVDYFDTKLPPEVRKRYPENKYEALDIYLTDYTIDNLINKIFPGGYIKLSVYYEDPEKYVKDFMRNKGVTSEGDIVVNICNILFNKDIDLTYAYQYDFIADYLTRNPDYAPITGVDPDVAQIMTKIKEAYFNECY